MSRAGLRVVFICGLLAVVAVGGCRARVTPGGAQGARADKARKQAVEVALDGFQGAAAAQAETLARANPGGTGLLAKGVVASSKVTIITASTSKAVAGDVPVPAGDAPSSTPPSANRPPKMSVRPGSPLVIKEQVVSTLAYAPSAEAEADEDVLNVARDLIERRLAELDPPVRYRPSLNEVKNEFVRGEKFFRPLTDVQRELYAKNGLGTNLVFVGYDVEVTAAQVRDLRTRERLSTTLRVFGVVTVVALAGFLFLRTDEWTKGYLTRWLAVAAVLLTGVAAAALYFV